MVTSLCPALSDEAFVAPATAREIAADLVVTEAAVKQHLLRLYQKFRIPEGANRRVRLANEVVALGLVRPLPPAERAQAPAERPQPAAEKTQPVPDKAAPLAEKAAGNRRAVAAPADPGAGRAVGGGAAEPSPGRSAARRYPRLKERRGQVRTCRTT